MQIDVYIFQGYTTFAKKTVREEFANLIFMEYQPFGACNIYVRGNKCSRNTRKLYTVVITRHEGL